MPYLTHAAQQIGGRAEKGALTVELVDRTVIDNKPTP